MTPTRYSNAWPSGVSGISAPPPPPPQAARTEMSEALSSVAMSFFMGVTFGGLRKPRASIAKSRARSQDRSVRRSSGARLLWLQHLVHDEQVRQQRAQVNRSVQVVDELRADVLAREREPQGRERDAGIGVDGREKSGALLRELRIESLDARIDDGAQPLERGDHLVEVFANVAPCRGAFVGLTSLRRIREHELVSGLDRLDALFEIVARHHRSTCQRSGSWCSVSSRRVIQPKIIARVNTSFSGRSAK